MSHILFTWEFGAGLGHLTRLIPIARELLGYGHRLTLAVPHPEVAQGLVSENFGRNDNVRLIKGSSWLPPTGRASLMAPTHTLADVLVLFEYDNFDKLLHEVIKWEHLVRSERPDIVVSDFSPTLRLALAGRLAQVVLGNGYTIPPAGRLLPPIRPWEVRTHPLSRAHEALIWRSMNQLRRQRGDSPVCFVADMFSGDRTFVCTIPEFDPYDAYRESSPFPPFNILPPLGVQQQRDRHSAFVYLPNTHPMIVPITRSLTELGIQTDVYIPNFGSAMAREISNRHIIFHEFPVQLNRILPRKGVIIHHAGLGTAFEAGLSATPQILIPKRLEHGVTSRALIKLGCGLEISNALREEELTNAIHEFIMQDSVYGASERVSKIFKGYWMDDSHIKISSCINEMC